MSKYIYMIYLSYKTSIIYRSEVFLKIIHSIIILSVQVLLWKALYSNNVTDTVISLREMTTYLILSTSFSAFMFDRSMIWNIGGEVKTGNISTQLARPVSYMLGKFSNQLGRILYILLFNVIPIFIIAIMLFGFTLPQSPYQFILTIIFIINSFFIFSMMYFIISLSAFWFMDVHGMVELMLTSFLRILSGAVIPLWYFPNWLKSITYLSPTRLGFDLPLSIYLGKIDSSGILQGLLTQIIWFLILSALNFIIWKSAVRRLNIQGG